MSERGVFAVDRGIWDHPVFEDEPMTQREAWQWLIGEAAFKARRRNVSGRVVDLQRGQLAASIRFMAERWKWSKSSVDRFLDKLRSEDMIGTDTGTGMLLITIRNYNKFQRVSLPDGTDNGTDAGQQRDKTEDIKNTKDKDISIDWPKDFREVFWAAYPRRVGKQSAFRALDRIRKRGQVPWEKLILAVQSYAKTADPAFTKHPDTWLNKGCWDDEPAKLDAPQTAALTDPTKPNWNPWRTYFRDTGKNNLVLLMDKAAADGKPWTVPTEYPPGWKAA